MPLRPYGPLNPHLAISLQAAIRSTAYHEAGHALVALYTPGADQLHKATINPRGEALGLTWQIPPSDEHSSSLTQMRARIDVAMGGTVAEFIAFGQERVGIGATSDLRAATETARFLVCECGFSDKIGPMKIDEKASSIQRHAADLEVRVLNDAVPVCCVASGTLGLLLQWVITAGNAFSATNPIVHMLVSLEEPAWPVQICPHLCR